MRSDWYRSRTSQLFKLDDFVAAIELNAQLVDPDHLTGLLDLTVLRARFGYGACM